MAIDILISAGNTARVTVVDSSSNTSLTINKPANVVNGDLMILKLGSNNTLNPSSLTLGGGWNSIAQNFTTANGGNACHTAGYWRYWNTGDPTSWTATIGADIRDDESFVFRVTGAHPTSPIGAVSTFNSTQSVSPVNNAFTTTANNSVGVFMVSAKNGSVITAEDTGNPSGTTLIQSKRTRNASGGMNSGLAYQAYPTSGTNTGTKTWTNYTTTAQYHSTLGFEILEAPAYTVSDVNTDEVVRVGSTGNTFSYSGFTGNPTAVNIASKSATNVSASGGSGTFDFPDYVDGQTYPLVGGSQTFTATYNSEQASLSVTLSPKVGHSVSTMNGAVSDDDTYIGYHFTLADNDTIDYVTSELTVNADGGVTTTTPGTYQLWHRATSTGVMTLLNVTVNEAGIVSVSTGKISIGIGLGIGI